MFIDSKMLSQNGGLAALNSLTLDESSPAAVAVNAAELGAESAHPAGDDPVAESAAESSGHEVSWDALVESAAQADEPPPTQQAENPGRVSVPGGRPREGGKRGEGEEGEKGQGRRRSGKRAEGISGSVSRGGLHKCVFQHLEATHSQLSPNLLAPFVCPDRLVARRCRY